MICLKSLRETLLAPSPSEKRKRTNSDFRLRFDSLPNDIIYEVFSFLSPSELFTRAALLNKRFCWIVKYDSSFWRVLASKHMMSLEVPIINSTKAFFRRNRCTAELIEYWKSLDLYRHHLEMTNASDSQRKVVCAVRFLPNPVNPIKINYDQSGNLQLPQIDEENYKFSRVYSPLGTEEMIYRENVAFPVLNSVMSLLTPTDHIPANAQKSLCPQTLTFLSYGAADPTLFNGTLPRVCKDLFSFLKKYKRGSSSCHCSPSLNPTKNFTLKLSMFDIADENIYDLAAEKKEPLQISEDILGHRINIEGLKELAIETETQMVEEIAKSFENRTEGHTYSFVIIKMMVQDKQTNLVFVEWKASQTTSEAPSGAFRRPTTRTNACVFDYVVSAINRNRHSREHVPYRSSKTTRLLQDSFAGEAKTTFMFNCSAEEKDVKETLAILSCAQQAFELRNSVACRNLSKFY